MLNCGEVAKHDGIFVVHLRSYGADLFEAIAETITISEKSGCPLHLSHFNWTGIANEGRSKEMLDMVDEARARGVDITSDSIPYIGGNGFLVARLPIWVQEGGPEKILQRLSDHKARSRIKDEFNRLSPPPQWDKFFIAAVKSAKNKEFEGHSVDELSRRLGKDAIDFICDLLVEENLEEVSHVIRSGDEQDVSNVLIHPGNMVGSDSLYLGSSHHPRTYGTFPRFLGYYVRQLGLLTLEEAIRRITSLSAERLRLKNRGLLKEDYFADIVVFNSETIIDKATFENPRVFSEGIEHVVVNGKIVVKQGKHTGATPGRALKP